MFVIKLISCASCSVASRLSQSSLLKKRSFHLSSNRTKTDPVMKLDATDLRYITADEFRVLTAVEQGSRNHYTVPTSMIAQISRITGGQVNKCLGGLAKRKLVGRVQNASYDGYRLTYGGLDFLALKSFSKRTPVPSVSSVGNQIGVGKEGDIYIIRGKGKRRLEDGDVPEEQSEQLGAGVDDDEEQDRILKIHRLGRISFRAIKSKRDYLGNRKSASWMYMSRLSAKKEWEFMKVLYDHGFPVPEPIDQARHCIVMSLVQGFPLRQIAEDAVEPSDLYSKLMVLIVRFAYAGLIHGDFNEFNIMIKDADMEPVVIDFPQMTSTRHANAEFFFDRDVNSIRKFFRKRFRFESEEYPEYSKIMKEIAEVDATSNVTLSKSALETQARLEGNALDDRPKRFHLDQLVEASGFSRKLQEELEGYMEEVEDAPAENEDYQSEEGSTDEEETSSEEEETDSDDEDDEGEDEVPELVARVDNMQIKPRRTAPSRASASTRRTQATDLSDLSTVVSQDMARQRARAAAQHHTRKGISDAGKGKGAKWKNSAAGKVGEIGGFF